MGGFAHAQTVDTRPLFLPPTWPGYEARDDGDVACEGRDVCVQKFHSWVKCTMTLTNTSSNWMSNASSSLWIILLRGSFLRCT